MRIRFADSVLHGNTGMLALLDINRLPFNINLIGMLDVSICKDSIGVQISVLNNLRRRYLSHSSNDEICCSDIDTIASVLKSIPLINIAVLNSIPISKW